MAHLAVRRWTTEEFFAWQERQAERYELVGGLPIRMMAGATRVHDRIVINILVELRHRLRGSGCEPFSGDGSIETWPGQIRRPDAGVDCGQARSDALVAAAPRMVAEVLSPSTRDFDTAAKLAEYKGVPTIDYVLVVEPNRAEIVLWSRRDGAWMEARIEGLDAAADMPGLGLTLPLAAIYEGVTFPEAPIVSGI